MTRSLSVAVVLPLVAAAGLMVAAGEPRKAEPASSRAAEPACDEKPGARHACLTARAGRYTVKSSFSMGAGSKPVETTGEATARSILGGRFVQIDETGTQFGEPFEACKTLGFNTASGKYEGVWIYTGSTAVMTMAGTSADDGKTINCTAVYDGGKAGPQEFGVAFTETDADRFTILFTVKQKDGTPGPSLRSDYTRVK